MSLVCGNRASWTTLIFLLAQLFLISTVCGQHREENFPAPSNNLEPVSGTIAKCGTCTLNYQPVLKEFLTEGGAESFENLVVIDSPKRTRKTILTVYHRATGKAQHVMELQSHHYQTRETLEALLLGLGFVLKSDDEIEQIQAKYRKQAQLVAVGKTKSELDDGETRQYLMTEAWKAAEALKQPGEMEEINKISKQIKHLKQQSSPTENTMASIKELEQKRTLLLRQQMLQLQFQIPPERINTRQ